MQAIGKQSANAEQTLYIFATRRQTLRHARAFEAFVADTFLLSEVDGVMPKSSDRMGDLYERWSADDGFLHVRPEECTHPTCEDKLCRGFVLACTCVCLPGCLSQTSHEYFAFATGIVQKTLWACSSAVILIDARRLASPNVATRMHEDAFLSTFRLKELELGRHHLLVVFLQRLLTP